MRFVDRIEVRDRITLGPQAVVMDSIVKLLNLFVLVIERRQT